MLKVRSAFTLAELMIVIGAIGILAGIVVTAVNPRDQLIVANNAKRTVAEREITRIIQYAMTIPEAKPEVDEVLQEIEILQASNGQADICAAGQTPNDCVSFDGLLEVIEQVGTLPVDVLAPEGRTGFSVTITPTGLPKVTANHRQKRSTPEGGNVDPEAEPPTPPDYVNLVLYEDDFWSMNVPAHWAVQEDASLSPEGDELTGTAFVLPWEEYAGTILREAFVHVAVINVPEQMPTCPVYTNPVFTTINDTTYVSSAWSFTTNGGSHDGAAFTLDAGGMCYVITLYTLYCPWGYEGCEPDNQYYNMPLWDVFMSMVETFSASAPGEGDI